jgi:anti-sigma B factor antagonist
VTGADPAISWSGRHAVVIMPSEIDISNSGEVCDLLLSVIRQDPDTITADLTRTTFCDSAGIHAIVRVNRQARSRGAELRLAVGGSRVARVLELTGLDRIIPVYPSAAESRHTPRGVPH